MTDVAPEQRAIDERQDASAPGTPPRAGRRLTLGARSLIGMLAIVAVSVGVCSWAVAASIRGQIEHSMRSHARSVLANLEAETQTMIAAGDREGVAEVVSRFMNDARLCFAGVEMGGGLGRVLRTRDGVARLAHEFEEERVRPRAAARARSHTLDINGRVVGVSCVKPLGEDASDRVLGASLAVGVMYPSYRELGVSLGRTALTTACVVGLGAAPIIAISVRRLTQPIRRVALAAQELSSGRRPEPAPERGPGEVATLARSFNTMAARLSDAREALEQANRDLEAAVEARTLELRRVNDLLRVEVTEKNEFLRTVSHDLGAPLRNIAGMALVLIRKHRDELSDEAIRRLERITANVELEAAMLADVLELTSIGAAGEQVREIESGTMAREIVEALDEDIIAREVEVTIDDGLPRVRVEAGRFRTVLQNLIDNAVKHMGDAPVRRVRVSCSLDDAGATFTIDDSGPGVPEDERERVFQLFRRGSQTDPSTPGRGLGLAAVRAVVQRWSGRIWIEGAPGGGSRFIFTMPAERIVREAAV